MDQALTRLDQDADRPLTIRASGDGTAEFVGVPARAEVDNPAVTSKSSVSAAADAHLERYGAALGADAVGTTLVRASIVPAVSGQQVVRYQQEVDGLPVIGGETVVSVRPDKELGSIRSTGSDKTAVERPVLTETEASAVALGAAGKAAASSDGLRASAGERWLYDPALLSVPSDLGARSVWRFEVTGGPAVRRMVLVDDQTGAVLLNLDQIAEADRIVCDNNSALRTSQVPCTAPVRSEGDGAYGVADVDLAYDYAGDTADLYGQLGVDLTDLVGTPVGGVKKLASTVRYCFTGAGNCPYENAFWNGSEMYYGAGFASGDDVVGHEITHGVTERTSNLLYFGQSGAINESLSDIMGEIVDHRNGAGTDVPGNWDQGEDLPPAIGIIRNMANPPTYGQPDKMTSALWTADTNPAAPYSDSGGVHTNSGVGNKTFYLLSQGGSFNGQSITGIDTGSDTGPNALIKSARLFLNVDQSLTSGSDYADLAVALDQGCQDLLASGSAGFTAADCTNVHKAVLATQLTTTPTNAPQPADAPATCPAGTVKRTIFDSETGSPETKLTAQGGWGRGSSALWGSNATSGKDSWFNDQDWSDAAMTPHQESLVAPSAIALPAGQASYLRFQQWRVLDYGGGAFFDGGTVQVNGDSAAVVAAKPWVNGPSQTISGLYGSPIAGQKAFGGDSFGWVASRLDLSSYAGTSVTPKFTLSFDNGYAYPGWWLDDVTVYTCDDEQILNTARPTVIGTAAVGTPLTAGVGTWTPDNDPDFAYQWFRGGELTEIPGATGATYTPTTADLRSNISVRVTATKPGYLSDSNFSALTPSVVHGTITSGKPTVTGTARVGSTVSATPGTWAPSDVQLAYQWLRHDSPISGATGTTYVATSADRGNTLSVRVTATKDGFGPAVATSAPTAKVDSATLTKGKPSIKGKAQVGKRLTAVSGAWQPSDTRFAYQWLRNGKVIKNAQKRVYTPSAADQGKRISVRVAGMKVGYTTAWATSKATGKVKGKPKKRR